MQSYDEVLRKKSFDGDIFEMGKMNKNMLHMWFRFIMGRNRNTKAEMIRLSIFELFQKNVSFAHNSTV